MELLSAAFSGLADCLRTSRGLLGCVHIRRVTFHELRHFYASLLVRHGESVKVQARLGHAPATETLNTYAHLWPDSDDRSRDAIDTAFPHTGHVWCQSRG